MTTMKKKILVGMLSGAILFAGGLGTYKVYAAEQTNAVRQETDSRQFKHHERPQAREMSEADITKFSQKIADKYGVNQSEVAQALKDHKHMRDVKMAAMFSKLSGKSFSEIMDMKCGWKEVGDKLGIKPEQMHEFFEQEMAEKLAAEGSMDVKTVNDLIKSGYEPFDIVIAGKIAKASNKDIKSVLAKRKINNTWEDVAKEYNVDMKTIMPKGPGRGEHSHMRPGK